MADPPRPAFLAYLVAELGRLHRERRSGTLFATTMNSRLAQFGIERGEVVFLSFQNSQGMEALDMLREQQTEAGVSRFAEGRHRGPTLQLPVTEELLKLLQAGPDQTPPSRAGETHLTHHIKTVIERELTEIIGPISAVLCQDVWSSVTTLDQALTALSRELPDPGQAEEFRQNVLKRLG